MRPDEGLRADMWYLEDAAPHLCHFVSPEHIKVVGKEGQDPLMTPARHLRGQSPGVERFHLAPEIASHLMGVCGH